MFEEYDGAIESGEGVKVYDNDKIIGEVRAYPYEDGTFVHYLGYVKDGKWLRPDQNEEEIREMKLQYPKLGLELLRWSRENLKPPFYAAFANQELRRILRAEPTGDVIPPELTGEPDDVSIDRLRVAKYKVRDTAGPLSGETTAFFLNEQDKVVGVVIFAPEDDYTHIYMVTTDPYIIGEDYDIELERTGLELAPRKDPYAANAILRWILKNLKPPYKADFWNGSLLESVAKKRPDLIYDESTFTSPKRTVNWKDHQPGERGYLGSLNHRLASFLIEAATFEEVVDLLRRTDLKEGSKYDKRYPGVIPTLISVIENVKPEHQEDVKWALRQFVALHKGGIKSYIDALNDHKWRMEQKGDQDSVDLLNARIKEILDRFSSEAEYGILKSELELLASIKPVIDRYNMTFDWDEASRKGIASVVGDINAVVRDREEYRELVEEAKDLAKDGKLWNGDIVYQFDNGWAIWNIADNADAKTEGELADHCIGSPDQGHCIAIENQNILAFSLRDKNQIPWATITMSTDRSRIGEAYARHDHPITPEHQEMISEWLSKFAPNSEWFNRPEGERTGEFTPLSELTGEEVATIDPYDSYTWPVVYHDYPFHTVDVRNMGDLFGLFDELKNNLPLSVDGVLGDAQLFQPFRQESDEDYQIDEFDSVVELRSALVSGEEIKRAVPSYSKDDCVELGVATSLYALLANGSGHSIGSEIDAMLEDVRTNIASLPIEYWYFFFGALQAESISGAINSYSEPYYPKDDNDLVEELSAYGVQVSLEEGITDDLALAPGEQETYDFLHGQVREAASTADLDQTYVMLMYDVVNDIYEIQSSVRIGDFDQAYDELEQIVDVFQNMVPETLTDDLIYLLQELAEALRNRDADDALKITPLLLYSFEGGSLYDKKQNR